MRGVSTGSAEYRTDSQVAVYLDDQPMTSISQQVDVRLIDIARIESLPGPQGTLFGSSSQSGTLRYITNKPDPIAGFDSQFDIELGTTRGGEESYDFSGHLNIPVTDSFAVRAVGFYSHEGGYVDNVLGLSYIGDQDNAAFVEEDYNDYDVYGGRVAARWIMSPRWETTLSLITQESRADGAWETDPALGDYKITRFYDEWRDDDWYQASMNIKGDLGFAELSVTGSYFDRDINYQWDDMLYSQWRTYAFAPDNGGGLYDTDYLIGTTFNWQKQNRWAYEVRLTSLGESRFQWMVGGFYEDVYDWWDYGAKIPGLTTTDSWVAANYYACYTLYNIDSVSCPLADTEDYYVNVYDKTIKQKAVFGETTYWVLPNKWSLTAGARWFQYDRRELDTYEVPRGLPSFRSQGDVAVGLFREGKDESTVFKFGTEFHFDEDRMAYFLYSEGFRLGGNNSVRAASTGVLPLEYQPDTLKNHELGFKSKWLDGKLLLNVALFYMKWTDIQLNEQASPYWVRGTFNGGAAEQKGIEINGTVNFTNNFSLQASVFRADPEFTEDTVYPDDSILPSGTTMPISPEEKYWASLNYTFPDFIPANGNLWTRFAYSYQSETWASVTAIMDNNRERLVPSWSSGTFQVGYSHDDGWDAALVVRNVFDETGVNWISSSNYSLDGSTALPADPRFRYVRTLQKPRTISLSFTKKW